MDKRKRAAVLALLALFCTAAATYVAVDWNRVSGGFAALFKGTDDNRASGNRAMAAAALTSSLAVAKGPAVEFMPQDGPAAQPEVALLSTRRHVASVGGGSGSFKSKAEDDLFKDGDPAAGIPSGKFIVAQNDSPAAPELPSAAPLPGGAGGGDVPGAPGPTGNGGAGGGGVLQTSPTAPAAAVPEASSLAMMSLGALFLAVAATRRRKRA